MGRKGEGTGTQIPNTLKVQKGGQPTQGIGERKQKLRGTDNGCGLESRKRGSRSVSPAKPPLPANPQIGVKGKHC